MKFSDRVTGLILVALGIAAFYGGSLFPPVPGQQVGPSVFPMVVGGGLVLMGGLIALGIGQTFEQEAEAEVAAHALPDPDEERYEAANQWRIIIPPALLLFYYLCSEWIGFVPAAAIMIATLAYAFGASWRAFLPLALAGSVLIHLLFVKLLRVPLPPGLLPMPW